MKRATGRLRKMVLAASPGGSGQGESTSHPAGLVRRAGARGARAGSNRNYGRRRSDCGSGVRVRRRHAEGARCLTPPRATARHPSKSWSVRSRHGRHRARRRLAPQDALDRARSGSCMTPTALRQLPHRDRRPRLFALIHRVEMGQDVAHAREFARGVQPRAGEAREPVRTARPQLRDTKNAYLRFSKTEQIVRGAGPDASIEEGFSAGPCRRSGLRRYPDHIRRCRPDSCGT